MDSLLVRWKEEPKICFLESFQTNILNEIFQFLNYFTMFNSVFLYSPSILNVQK